jgi:hypothetical protein
MTLITCELRHLQERAHQRGYKFDEVKACVTRWNGAKITVDTSHPSYPAKPKKKPESSGPGTELKKLLGRIGITATPTCSCNKKAAVMDHHGCQWCLDNIEMLVGWLREEAEKRALPFLDLAGRLLIRRAVSVAQRKAHVPPGRESVHK